MSLSHASTQPEKDRGRGDRADCRRNVPRCSWEIQATKDEYLSNFERLAGILQRVSSCNVARLGCRLFALQFCNLEPLDAPHDDMPTRSLLLEFAILLKVNGNGQMATTIVAEKMAPWK